MRYRLWLTEGARMEALCREPSELINMLCLAQIEATDFREVESNRFSFLVPAAMADKTVKLGNRCGAEIRVLHRRGFFHFLRRFRCRAYLLLIPLPFLVFFALLSTRLWQIDVSGNVKVSRAEIMAALESVGVYPGVSGLHLDNPQIRSRMQEMLSELSWCTVQVHGSRALVVVRERRKPPKVVDDSEAREVYAMKTGTVDQLNILEGKALVRRGDTVLQGQTLISGLLYDRQEQSRPVHAMGRVFAWTWYEKSMELPLSGKEKLYTGDEETRYALKIGDLRLNFCNDSSIYQGCYDKIKKEERAELFGLPLPISLLTTKYQAYELLSWDMDVDDAVSLLKNRLLQWLLQSAPDAEIMETWFECEATGGVVRVRMLAQCREDIAAEREFSLP